MERWLQLAIDKIMTLCDTRNEPRVRFLGLILVDRLAYLPHIIISLTSKHSVIDLDLLLRPTSTSWSADRRSLLRLYTSGVFQFKLWLCYIYGRLHIFRQSIRCHSKRWATYCNWGLSVFAESEAVVIPLSNWSNLCAHSTSVFRSLCPLQWHL